ncbi:hypothetical protein FNY66_13275 [Mediterraneibacter catenae]|uniref:Uncharacterized protein n=1 Tax=Mediterraneibacter catenae TaxID=2594882 RepID=A0A5M9HUW1_9FIRM|nr:hypothetical protein [Mediterraneibacter catenae]KAA8500458.1 hypothetical protein FNY66_13275 [Mediterraneibacter catenae]
MKMKYLRVFTILFCLTLSMTILSACGNKEPSANSNPMRKRDQSGKLSLCARASAVTQRLSFQAAI